MNYQEFDSVDFENCKFCPFCGLKCEECSKNEEEETSLTEEGLQNETS